jgi:hypothetical protein
LNPGGVARGAEPFLIQHPAVVDRPKPERAAPAAEQGLDLEGDVLRSDRLDVGVHLHEYANGKQQREDEL